MLSSIRVVAEFVFRRGKFKFSHHQRPGSATLGERDTIIGWQAGVEEAARNQGELFMQPPSRSEPSRETEATPAIEHVAGAHDLLKALQQRIGEHPELAEAILKLENALSILTVKTGGLL